MEQLGYRATVDGLKRNLTEYKNAVWVAVLNHQVVGCIAFHILPQFHSDEKHMRIVSLIVDREHRKMGIGKLLLDWAEESALKMNCSVVELTCAAHRKSSGAHNFYSAQGFLADGEKVYFRKKLSG